MKTTSSSKKGRGSRDNSSKKRQSKDSNFPAYRALTPLLSAITGRSHSIGEIIQQFFGDCQQEGGENEANH